MRLDNDGCRFGDVFLMKFDGDVNEQKGWRPGVVFQNNMGNEYSPNIIALPMTSSLKKVNQPTHVLIRSSDTGLLKDSMVLCENPERISKHKIGKYLTTLPRIYISEIAQASLLATSAIAFVSPEDLLSVREKAQGLISLN